MNEDESKLLNNIGTEGELLPKNHDDVIKIVDDFNSAFPLENKRRIEKDGSPRKLDISKHDAMENIFDPEKRKNLSHKEVLEYEYIYNSEDEFGNEDAFEKARIIKNPDDTMKKLKSINGLLEKLKQNALLYKKVQNYYRSKISKNPTK